MVLKANRKTTTWLIHVRVFFVFLPELILDLFHFQSLWGVQ